MMGAPYATKKSLKEQVGKRLRVIETSMFGSEYNPNGVNYVVGPDPYNNRKWYAAVTLKDGLIVNVK